ncbi:MAG: TRAP transporter substrate-binding protein DctP [Chloroflexi bacterium]|nr:TRAP transporter substrate-binding protein DctP [Chloroflexota bacterium]
MGLWMLRDKVKEMSNGEMVIEVLGGTEVIPLFDQGMAVKNGVVDMAQTFATTTPLVPVASTIVLSRMTAREERAGGYFDFLVDEYAKAGIRYLGRAAHSDGPIFNLIINKQIDRPSIAGMKIGGIGPISNALIEAMGGVPVFMDFPEVYVALETGVANGYWDTTNNFVALKIFELPLYMIDYRYYQADNTFIINPAVWDRLSQRHKDVLMNAIIEQENEVAPLYRAELDKNRQTVIDRGVKPIKFSSQDAEWFIETAYRVELENQVKLNPQSGPRAKELLTKK